MKPTIYQSTDPNAPILNEKNGSLNIVLKACLVTGYGDKQGAGWQILKDDKDTHKLVINSPNPKSSHHVLSVTDVQNSAKVIASKGWDNQIIGKYHEGYFIKNFDYTGSHYWIIIATDQFFYLWIQTELNSNYMGVLYGFGDVISLWQDKNYSALMCNSDTSYTHDNTGHASIMTSEGLAYFPNGLFAGFSNYWGDRSLDRYRYDSRLAMFTKLFLRMTRGDTSEPAIELPGMLMPYSEIWGYQSKGHLQYLQNQAPFANPVVGLYQPWHGRVWIQTDDWSESNVF